MKFNLKLALMATLVVGFAACSDDKNNGGYSGSNPYVAVLAYAPATGYDFSYYPIQCESVSDTSQTLDASGTGDITQVGYYEYNQLNQSIYSTGGLDYTDVSAISKSASGPLVKDDFGINFTNSVVDMISTDDGKLIGIEMSNKSDVLVLHLIDVTTNELIKTETTSCYEISENMYKGVAEDNTPFDFLAHNTGLAQSGNYIYVSYFVFGPSSSTPFVEKAEVAIFSYPELKYISTITDERTGPLGGWNTNSGLFNDENGNIYCVSHTNPANGYSQSNAKAGILRINKNETSFDADYFFDLTATGDGYTTANILYMNDGKAFAEMNVAARSEQTTWADAPLKGAILDLNAKTVAMFDDCPEHAGPGRDIVSTALYTDGVIYNPITVDKQIYIYKLDPSDMSVTRGLQVNASFVAGLFRLN
ncbi:MAG: DUF4374 domain-containing protein [Mangrovibacterium sp.]